MGQDGDRMGMWHISIPERRTHPLFFRYPLYRNSERNRSSQPAAPAPQRNAIIAPQPPAQPPRRLPLPRAHRSHHLQAILHVFRPTQQKYNFVPFKSQK